MSGSDRRTFLARIVTIFSVVGLAGLAYPFLGSWLSGPRREVTLDVDVTDLKPGDARLVRWLGRHVYIVRRDLHMVNSLTMDSASLEDPASTRSNQPAFAFNARRSIRPEHLLVFANCTHLGCEVEPISRGGFKGFRCPCHASEFDAAGRVGKGSAARFNLEVPEYGYAGRHIIRLKKV